MPEATSWRLVTAEFAKEAERLITVQPMPVFNGPMFGGQRAATTWLRLASRYDAAHREYEVRMASSTDGPWSWGGTWSLPAEGPLKIGLVSMITAAALATFDYVHTYRLAMRGVRFTTEP